MIGGEGPVFHGSVHGSQLAWGNQDVSQTQHHASGIGIEGLREVAQLIYSRAGDLGLSREDESVVLQGAQALHNEASVPAPDPTRLRRLAEPVISALGTALATGVTGSVLELARSMLTGLQEVLP
ncbi:hypothetical protein [Streptomyces sp. NPDC053079]|uniref:hypothetical protein n=1 Tax=Streptomyces sp. NPDC053079 TaxID=3365697 RepID=UPI0037CD921A